MSQHMDDSFESGLGTAMRSRTDDIHPDLHRLAAASLRAGVRIRRRRRIGASLGSVAAVAAVLGAAAIGSSLGGSPQAQSPGFAGTSGSPGPAAPHRTGLHPLNGSLPRATGGTQHRHSPGGATTPRGGPYDDVLAKARTALSPAWTCGTIADDKFACEPDGFGVVARPRSDLANWQIKGSVEASQVAWIGKDCFLTVQGPSGAALDKLKAKVAAAER